MGHTFEFWGCTTRLIGSLNAEMTPECGMAIVTLLTILLYFSNKEGMGCTFVQSPVTDVLSFNIYKDQD